MTDEEKNLLIVVKFFLISLINGQVSKSEKEELLVDFHFIQNDVD